MDVLDRSHDQVDDHVAAFVAEFEYLGSCGKLYQEVLDDGPRAVQPYLHVRLGE